MHQRVPQHVTLYGPIGNGYPELLSAVRSSMAANPHDFKIIVFFVTARLTQLAAELFNNGYKIPALEIHSRKSQSNRTKTAKKFREGKGKKILFFDRV